MICFFEAYRILRADGETRWIQDKSFPIFDRNKKLLGFAGIAQDITEDRKREQEEMSRKEKESADKVRDQIIQNLNHDIQTPLNGIIGMTELLINETENTKHIQVLDQIYNATASLLSLMNEMFKNK